MFISARKRVLVHFWALNRKIRPLKHCELKQNTLLQCKTTQKCDLEGLELACSLGSARISDISTEKGAKVRILAYRAYTAGLTSLILTPTEVWRGSKLLKPSWDMSRECNKAIWSFPEGQNRLILALQGKKCLFRRENAF